MDVEIFTSGSARSLARDATVTIRVGNSVRTISAGEWSRLIANPKRAPENSPA